MDDTKIYSADDALRTAELKKHSLEVKASENRAERELIADAASREIFRRTRRLMLYENLDYEQAASLIVRGDHELSELWIYGFIRE